MDESALLARLNSLESSWASLDSWLKFWILLVVVGVAMEVVVVVIEYRHERRAFNRGIIRPPDRPSRCLFAFGLLGAGLVAIGVAGEFGIHIKAGRVEAEMRNATDSLVAIANGKAGEAKERAANNEHETARLKLENTKLLAVIQPRSLTTEQQREMGDALRPFKGRTVVYAWNVSDPETYNFAIQLAAAFKCGKLDVRPFISMDYVPKVALSRAIPDTGVMIAWGVGQKDLAIAIQRALRSIGHVRKVWLREGGFSGMEQVYVSVYVKPFDVLQ
jgi:hypothetical protein